jgi:hypothetical protein
MGASRSVLLFAVVIAALALAWSELWIPAGVPWQAIALPGCAAERAEGLVLQEEMRDGTVWATRGYAIYRSVQGGPFERVGQVRPPLGEAWGGYSRSLRRAFGYQELVELIPLGSGTLIAFAGGAIFRIDLAAQMQEEVYRLRYFGRGKGRGVMSRIAVDERGRIFFGEYTTARDGPHTVRIVRGSDDGRSWTTVHEFAAGEAFHIHGLEWDPFGRALWVMTGDADEESRIGFSRDGGETFEWVGEHAQAFRACGLVFGPDAVLWATDSEENHLMRWSRTTHLATALGAAPAQSLYAQGFADGTGIIAQSTWDASAALVDASGTMKTIARFTPTMRPGQPFAGVRLARGSASSSPWIYLNPLRTEEEEAAIFRIPARDLQQCSPPPPRFTQRPAQ